MMVQPTAIFNAIMLAPLLLLAPLASNAPPLLVEASPSAHDVASSIKVIGAGFGRTGTDSLRIALNTLGFRTYHMIELLGFGERSAPPLEMLGLGSGHNEAWVAVDSDAAAGKSPDFRFLHEGYNYTAAVDAPSAMFWPELLAQNPDARVILTVRDDPDRWWKSINGAFCRIVGAGSTLDRIVSLVTHSRPYGRRNARMHRAMDRAVQRVLGGDSAEFSTFSIQAICDDREYALRFIEAWNRRARDAVPRRQLLEFRTGRDGYRELARFLGVNGRDVFGPGGYPSYPHSNSKEEFANILVVMRVLTAITVASVGGAAGLILWIWRRKATVEDAAKKVD